ncbi:MAG TPA: anthranilate synthase component I family protein [Thermoanaerobaculia bacterium]|nr:anthranilate synthase component I family protein [Thermoanaerobaculia bacterium]
MDRRRLLSSIARPGAALLDGWSDTGRWTIALPEPVDVFTAGLGETARIEGFLDRAARATRPDRADPSPFAGGWVGFLSYELGASWEGADPRADPVPEPAAVFFRHDSGWAIDPAGTILPIGRPRPLPAEDASFGGLGNPGSVGESLERPAYRAAHEAIRGGIARGDYYQVNLTNRFAAGISRRSDPRSIYAKIAGDSPPPYSLLLAGGGFDVVSASPELFLRADFRTRSVEMRPIKGTAPRANDPGADAAAAAALRDSAKDRAENVMIVDLCRNDLGRVCETGTVDVPDLCRIRSHRVHHLESVVSGTLRRDATAGDVIRATFPPGSVTGAPRRAAVAAIRALEPCARGVYTGATGFLDDRGRLAFNVAIRTAIATDSEIRYHAGGGITWESVAEREREEIDWKAAEFLGLFAGESR